jgi:hypothetical protein
VVWWNYWGVWGSALQKRIKFKYYEEDFCTAETNGAQAKLEKKRREEDAIDSDVVVNRLLQLSRSIYTLTLERADTLFGLILSRWPCSQAWRIKVEAVPKSPA